MKPPSDHILCLLRRAAELRAAGKSWEAVGGAVHRAPETVRRWPREYPAEWKRCYLVAEASLLAEAAAEALQYMRVMLRSENERSVIAAGQLLLKSRLADRDREEKPDREPDEEVAAYIEAAKMTDEELDYTIGRFAERRGYVLNQPKPEESFDPGI
ncbi:MAG: hypothetical protein ACJ8F7_04505 [Gemmataceae bacterium]